MSYGNLVHTAIKRILMHSQAQMIDWHMEKMTMGMICFLLKRTIATSMIGSVLSRTPL